MKLHAPPDRTEDIKKWQIQTYDGAEANVSRAIISTLYDVLINSLKALLQHAKQEEPESPNLGFLERNLTALFFWGRDHGVSQGELDAALQFSHRLRDTVLTLLVSLGDLLSQGLIHLVSAPEQRQAILKTSDVVSLTEDARLLLEEPPDTVEYRGVDLKQLCISLQNITQGLTVLSSSLEAIAEDEIDDEEVRAWVQLKDRAAHEHFVDLISSRFPSANQELVQALGQSNWDRYNYVQRLRNSAANEPDQARTDKARSEFHDSGLGSSAPPQSVMGSESCPAQADYAAPIVSSRAESSHKRLPPLPEVARSGTPFECDICSRWVNITRTKDWKRHIFDDICAYTCIFSDCSSARTLFKNRETMTQHLESHHSITSASVPLTCPLCLENVPGGSDLVSLHFSRHMEEIALSVLPHGAESEDGTVSADEDIEEQALHNTPRPDLTDPLIDSAEEVSSTIGYEDSKDKALSASIWGMDIQTSRAELLIRYREGHKRDISGWRKDVTPEERTNTALQLFTAYRILTPDTQDGDILLKSMKIETASFTNSQNKEQYMIAIKQELLAASGNRQSSFSGATSEPDLAPLHRTPLPTTAPETCKHTWNVIKSDTEILVWHCSSCHAGPHLYIYECDGCKAHLCLSCKSKEHISELPKGMQLVRPGLDSNNNSGIVSDVATKGNLRSNVAPGLNLKDVGYTATEPKMESSKVKCICGSSDDDGNTVLCEICDKWQHIKCYYESAANVPDVHECADCKPRPVDALRTAETQPQHRQTKDAEVLNSLETKKIKKGKMSCTTCRRRKQQCGREKPECARCIRTGLKCEGYRVIKQAHPEDESRKLLHEGENVGSSASKGDLRERSSAPTPEAISLIGVGLELGKPTVTNLETGQQPPIMSESESQEWEWLTMSL
ncbi:uncharacterized protein CC84DRAFT_1257937 [Paraphaeosphaeria sporulosa]|uniref:Zn(2)-C6 fungal-type domain-containing protein n=1 Tax=Paraphaeosphaeria sporulosa TaxID=1460663 RepID=A0A177CHF3_9PLEO|nr:uncharacterized protein CC84DRAFT_1257937 [Paraphaeosphaeria sporulosa]OAG06641.1 hypothetical protein CC84DRAFT_1257937 [Paraphaeosphaeria sporulosa]